LGLWTRITWSVPRYSKPFESKRMCWTAFIPSWSVLSILSIYNWSYLCSRLIRHESKRRETMCIYWLVLFLRRRKKYILLPRCIYWQRRDSNLRTSFQYIFYTVDPKVFSLQKSSETSSLYWVASWAYFLWPWRPLVGIKESPKVWKCDADADALAMWLWFL